MIYFEKPGKQNTEAALKAAVEAAKANGIKKIVVATCSGATPLLLKDCGLTVIVVTHQAGYLERGGQQLSEETKAELIAAGMKVQTASHLFAGVDRALNYKFGGVYPGEMIAHTLRILGEGFKAAVEIAVMAMDAGLIGADEDVVTVAGRAQGADTALVLTPAHSQYFFDVDVKEIICMPRGHKKQKKA